MLAGVAAGVYADLAEAGRAMVAPRARFDPDPANRARYDDAYDTYIELFDALRPLFGAGAPTP
jgi:ribulose kinase